MALQTVHACAIYVHCTNVIYSDYTPHTRHIHHTHVIYTTHVLNTPHAPYKPQLRHMTVSNCLFKKEQCEWFARDLSESLANNEQFAHKICMFHMFLTVFPLFYAQERIAPVALCSFLKSKLSDLLPLLFTKEGPWAIHWGHTWQKSNHELLAQVTHDKRATGVIGSFLRVNHSFALLLFGSQKWVEKLMSEFPTLVIYTTSVVYYTPHIYFINRTHANVYKPHTSHIHITHTPHMIYTQQMCHIHRTHAIYWYNA